MKPNKRQLQQEYDSVVKELGRRREMIERLREEKKVAYHEGYARGRHDEEKRQLNK